MNFQYYALEITSMEDFNNATDPKKILQEIVTENNNKKTKQCLKTFS